MEGEQFRKLVAVMRHAQKEYFRTRSTTALEESKRLEKSVDRELSNNGQRQMFDHEEAGRAGQ
jgi:hypothetical protein